MPDIGQVWAITAWGSLPPDLCKVYFSSLSQFNETTRQWKWHTDCLFFYSQRTFISEGVFLDTPPEDEFSLCIQLTCVWLLPPQLTFWCVCMFYLVRWLIVVCFFWRRRGGGGSLSWFEHGEENAVATIKYILWQNFTEENALILLTDCVHFWCYLCKWISELYYKEGGSEMGTMVYRKLTTDTAQSW